MEPLSLFQVFTEGIQKATRLNPRREPPKQKTLINSSLLCQTAVFVFREKIIRNKTGEKIIGIKNGERFLQILRSKLLMNRGK